MKALAAVAWIVVGYAVLLAAMYFWQHRLLYLPARATVDGLVGGGEWQAWPSPRAFRGLIAEPAGGPARGTAIVFHGNAGHVGDRAFYARALTPLGLRVILVEYPGYGPRDGAPGEAVLVADAAQTVALAHRLYGAPLLLIGESLGAAVAGAAAARQGDLVAGLLLITPWDRLANVASHHYPWLPVKWLLRDGYDTRQHLARFHRPVVIVVAANDSIVPARFGSALHAGLGGPKHLVVIEDSGHNDWPARADAHWWRGVVGLALG
jgi:hypothetical protein